MAKQYLLLIMASFIWNAETALGETYKADFSSYGCESDGCGFETEAICLSQLEEQKGLFKFATGLNVDSSYCAKRTRIERFYPVIEGKGSPLKTMQSANFHSWRSESHISLLALGLQKVIEADGGRIAATFIDDVKFSPSGSKMLRIFFYSSEGPQPTRFSESTLELSPVECKSQRKHVEKKADRSALTPSSSVFCDDSSGKSSSTLLITAQQPESVGPLSFHQVSSFEKWADCLQSREELLAQFPTDGIAVICRMESEESFSSHLLKRSK